MIFYPAKTQSAAIRAALNDPIWTSSEKKALRYILQFVEKKEEIDYIYHTEEWIENPYEIRNPLLGKVVFHGRWVHGEDTYMACGHKFMVEDAGRGYRIGLCYPLEPVTRPEKGKEG